MAGGKEIVVFTDGSYRGATAGLGVVMCVDGAVRIRSVPWPGCRYSSEAEVVAAAEGMEDALEQAYPGDRITLVVDFKAAARYVNDRRHGPREKSVDEVLGPVVDEVRGYGVTLDAVAINGHGRGREDYSARDAFLNGIADCLANLGRFGTAIDRTFLDDERLQPAMKSFDHRLDPYASLYQRRSFTRLEAARAIGVSTKVVDSLLRHGHLRMMPDHPMLTLSSVLMVSQEYRKMRAEARAQENAERERLSPSP